jgi:hypothetical protein
MFRWAGGAIGAVTAMVDRSIHPSKEVKVDLATFWGLLQLHLNLGLESDQAVKPVHRY